MNRLLVKQLIVGCVLSVLMSLAFCAGAWFFLVQSKWCMAFDLKRHINVLIRHNAPFELNEDGQHAVPTRFNTTMHSTAKDYVQEKGIEVLVSPAVASSAPDVTPEIQARIAHNMKAETVLAVRPTPLRIGVNELLRYECTAESLMGCPHPDGCAQDKYQVFQPSPGRSIPRSISCIQETRAARADLHELKMLGVRR